MTLERSYWRKPRLLFGQMREDVEVERALVYEHGSVRRAVVIASGGCLALSLLDRVAEEVWAVDINPAQVEFVRQKADRMRTLKLTGFREILFERSAEFPRGMQNAGRVDGILAVLRAMMFAGVHSREFVENFLKMDSVVEQSERFARDWDRWRWRAASSAVFNPAILRLGFGPEVRTALPGSFAALIRDRVERVLTNFPAVTNGYAWQSFLGRPAPGEIGLPIYAREAEFESLRSGLGRLRLASADVEDWLVQQDPQSVDFFALSNVLELAGAKRCERLLREVERTASDGAVAVFRSILPTGVGRMPDRLGRLHSDAALSQAAERRDQSVVCNFFQIYRAG